jgi:Tfp pilus assembly protein PilV
MKIKSTSGQSLIEVLTALAVVLLVLVALIRATTMSMRSGSFSKSQAQASSYAQEAIEWIRAERDKDWDNNIAVRANDLGNKLCLTRLEWPIVSGGCGEGDYLEANQRFKREVTLTSVGGAGNQVEVEVVVSWQESGGEHQSKLTTYLSNWR